MRVFPDSLLGAAALSHQVTLIGSVALHLSPAIIVMRAPASSAGPLLYDTTDSQLKRDNREEKLVPFFVAMRGDASAVAAFVDSERARYPSTMESLHHVPERWTDNGEEVLVPDPEHPFATWAPAADNSSPPVHSRGIRQNSRTTASMPTSSSAEPSFTGEWSEIHLAAQSSGFHPAGRGNNCSCMSVVAANIPVLPTDLDGAAQGDFARRSVSWSNQWNSNCSRLFGVKFPVGCFTEPSLCSRIVHAACCCWTKHLCHGFQLGCHLLGEHDGTSRYIFSSP